MTVLRRLFDEAAGDMTALGRLPDVAAGDMTVGCAVCPMRQQET